MKEAGRVYNSETHKQNREVKSEKHTQEELEATETDGSSVEFALGHTVNMGNFESVNARVSVRVACTVATLDEAGNLAEVLATERLRERVEEIYAKRARNK